VATVASRCFPTVRKQVELQLQQIGEVVSIEVMSSSSSPSYI
jgi:hypothetical protein